MKATTLDKILLSSLPADQVVISEKSGEFDWGDLFLKIESQWSDLRRSRERATPSVVVVTYRFDLTPSQFIKFDVRITHEQWKAAQKHAKDDAAFTTEKWINVFTGVTMKKPLFNNAKQRHEQKRVFWRQLPGCYGSAQ
jgi:hypothetical protein